MIRRAAILTTAALALLATPALAFGPQEFTAKSVEVDGVLGTLEVVVDKAATKVTASVTGPERWLQEVTVRQQGDRLVVEQKDQPDGMRRWDDRKDWVAVRLTVPVGTALEVEDFTGEGTVGDLGAALLVDDMTAGRLAVGNVATAKIGISGSGDIVLGDVARDLSVEINGSGDVRTGRTSGQLEVEINGSGDVEVARVDGPVKVEVNGSGDVSLKAGTADPLAVAIAGSGDVTLDGVARNQAISKAGSGDVRVTGRTGG